MLPALMEWDLAHPEANQGRAGTSAAAAAEVEFAPARVAKVQGSGGGRGGGWRFVLEWKRLEGDVEGLGALAPAQKRGESSAAAAAALAAPGAAAAPLADWDAAWLKDVDAEHRAARQTAVRRHWPALAAEWEQRWVCLDMAPRAGGAAKPQLLCCWAENASLASPHAVSLPEMKY
jgi:hypothetical protein